MSGKFTITAQKFACSYANVALASCCGRRRAMEDHHVFEETQVQGTHVYFAGIFDGHGGANCSHEVSKLLSFTFLDRLQKHACHFEDALNHKHIMSLARTCVYDIDRKCNAYVDEGSCALFAILWGNPEVNSFYSMILGNIGDSRALMLGKNGAAAPTITQLTTDHKPETPKEKMRIELAGGYVSNHAFDVPRTCGSLSLSRAFGDFRFKKNAKLDVDRQIISVCPDVRYLKVRPGDSLCFACDGVFETEEMNSTNIEYILRSGYANAEKTAKDLVKKSMYSGSGDNNTCLIMHF